MTNANKLKTKFQDVSEDELRQELILREADRRSEINRRNQVNMDFVFQHVKVLLDFTPDHELTSCSDEDPCNHGADHGGCRPRCQRCVLLEIQQDKYNSNLVLNIQLNFVKTLDNIPDRLVVRVEDR